MKSRVRIFNESTPEKATRLGVVGNGLLFLLKALAAWLTGSLAVLSDALNSLTDIFGSLAVLICVRVGAKAADANHPFGHGRAEPVAALIIAILAGVMGFEMMKLGAQNLWTREAIARGWVAVLALSITMLTKGGMALYLHREGRRADSPALAASATDSKNDVLVSAVALAGVLGNSLGWVRLDALAAFLIGLWIIRTGFRIGMKNIGYLMGKEPEEKWVEEIRRTALAVPGVKGVHDLRAHYVGNLIHAEIHVEIRPDLAAKEAHDIAVDVHQAVEKLPRVGEAFIHLDPL
ncbi:MAG: cation transporter [Candidatus Tectomicrobia bacterium]|nr:cation transporter [Candidatus Tectomicrobia bacterium]